MKLTLHTITMLCMLLACTTVADARVIQFTKLAFHYVPKTEQLLGKNTSDVREEEFLKLLTIYRKQHKKMSLTYDADLSDVAKKYAQYLQDNNHFDHNDKDWKDAGDRITGYGFPLSFWWEILAEWPSTDLVFEKLQGSPWHNAILLSNKYNKVGVGAVWNKWVAVFYYAKPVRK